MNKAVKKPQNIRCTCIMKAQLRTESHSWFFMKVFQHENCQEIPAEASFGMNRFYFMIISCSLISVRIPNHWCLLQRQVSRSCVDDMILLSYQMHRTFSILRDNLHLCWFSNNLQIRFYAEESFQKYILSPLTHILWKSYVLEQHLREFKTAPTLPLQAYTKQL